MALYHLESHHMVFTNLSPSFLNVVVGNLLVTGFVQTPTICGSFYTIIAAFVLTGFVVSRLAVIHK